MKRISIKILSAILLCFICIMTLTSCKSYEPIEPSEQDIKVVGNVGKFEVYYEEIRFAALKYRATLVSTYGEEELKNDPEKYEEMMWDHLTESILTNYAILHMCKELGIESSEPKLEEAVQKTIEETIDACGSTKKYKNYLEENNLTDHFLRFNTCVDKMQNELFYAYRDDLGLVKYDDAEIYDIIKDEFVRTQHIYISKHNGKTEDENKETLDKVLAELADGKDFFKLVEAYGDDHSFSEDGIYITRGYMSDEYEKVAYALEIDQYSDVIESEEGFYIIKRLAHDTLYVMLNFDELSDRYQQYAFIAMIDEYAAELEFVPNEYLKSLKLLEIK